MSDRSNVVPLRKIDGMPQAPEHANKQFSWLRQVAFDGGLPSSALHVAVALTGYFNRKHDGAAWMSQATLAKDLGTSDRTVRTALSALVENGHLTSERRGKEETNLYRLAVKSDRKEVSGGDGKKSSAHKPVVTGKKLQSDRKKTVEVTGRKLPTNPLNEPAYEPDEAPPTPASGGLTGRMTKSTPFPENVRLTDVERKIALTEFMPPADIEPQFKRFCLKHSTKRSKDWLNDWRRHCVDEKFYGDKRKGERKSSTKTTASGRIIPYGYDTPHSHLDRDSCRQHCIPKEIRFDTPDGPVWEPNPYAAHDAET